MRSCPEVEAYQVVRSHEGTVITYVAAKDLDERACREVQGRLAKAHPGLADTRLERVERLQQTIAGKTLMVVTS